MLERYTWPQIRLFHRQVQRRRAREQADRIVAVGMGMNGGEEATDMVDRLRSI